MQVSMETGGSDALQLGCRLGSCVLRTLGTAIAACTLDWGAVSSAHAYCFRKKHFLFFFYNLVGKRKQLYLTSKISNTGVTVVRLPRTQEALGSVLSTTIAGSIWRLFTVIPNEPTDKCTSLECGESPQVLKICVLMCSIFLAAPHGQ